MSDETVTLPKAAATRSSPDYASAEVLREPLYTQSEVREALAVGTLASAILGGLLGLGLGYSLALQERRMGGAR